MSNIGKSMGMIKYGERKVAEERKRIKREILAVFQCECRKHWKARHMIDPLCRFCNAIKFCIEIVEGK